MRRTQRKKWPTLALVGALALTVVAVASSDSNVLFDGSFDAGTYKPWTVPQCANYGHQQTTRTFGNFYVTGTRVGQGKYAGLFTLPADPNHLTRCELLTRRDVNVGGDDFYSLMVYLPKKWSPGTNAFWGVEIAQFNWEGMPGAPVSLEAHADHVTLVLESGVCGKPCRYRSNADAPKANLPPLYAIRPAMTLGVWHELIVHVHWATDSSGLVAVWHRVKGAKNRETCSP